MPPSPDDRFAPARRPVWEPERRLTLEDCLSAFEATAPFTVGLEEELMLLSPDTLDLEPAVDRVLARAGDEPRLRRELRASQVEITTPVCRTPRDALLQLRETRRALAAAAAADVLVAAAGTHPFSTSWGRVSRGGRYRAIAAEYGWPAKRSLACGLHVHIAVGTAGTALAVFNAMRSYVPELGALAANSPFHEGRDTGFASIRPKLNEAFPRDGIPPAFASWRDFVELVGWGRSGGAFPDATFLWWDLRPHPLFGTLELRVPDAQTAPEDAAAIAAVAQSLAALLARRHEGGEPLPVHDTFRISENLWSGLRLGLRGWLIDLDSGEPEPTRERVRRLLDEVEPVGAELGCAFELARARTLLAGNGADRQRYVADREGLDGLVRWLVEETVGTAASA